MNISKTDWAWWAGRDDEWMTIGPCATRDDAVSEAIDDIGEGEGDFIVMEAVMHDIHLSASCILDRQYDEWADNGDLFSTENGAPEPQGTPDQRKEAETELQALLDGWVAKFRHTFPTPNMFAATRNQETIRNTVDPDALAGGHDNPKEPVA